MTPSTVGGTAAGASHSWTNRNHSRGSDANASSDDPERKKCSASTRIPALGRPTAATTAGRGVEVADLHPRRELEVDGQSEVAGVVAQPSEPLDGPVPIGIRQLADDVTGADRRGCLEQPEVVVGVLVRSEPGEFDVEDAQPGVGETFVHSIDHRPITGQRDDLLARRHRVVRRLA